MMKNKITTVNLDVCDTYLSLWIFRSHKSKKDATCQEYIAHTTLRASRIINLHLAALRKFEKGLISGFSTTIV
jgi:hypothetical protein